MTTDLLTTEIPDKFKDPETGDLRADAFLQSYKELEKRMSQTPSAPKSPDDYCIECSHGLFTPDPQVNAKLHGLGMTQDQVQGVYDMAAQHLVPMVQGLGAQYNADREVEKLVNHFGGPDAWKEISRQLLAFGQRNLPADVLENLASSYEGVLALQRMMKTEEPGLKKGGDNPSSFNEQDLKSMMRDPKYWREKDPAFVAKVTDGFAKMYNTNGLIF